MAARIKKGMIAGWHHNADQRLSLRIFGRISRHPIHRSAQSMGRLCPVIRQNPKLGFFRKPVSQARIVMIVFIRPAIALSSVGSQARTASPPTSGKRGRIAAKDGRSMMESLKKRHSESFEQGEVDKRCRLAEKRRDLPVRQITEMNDRQILIPLDDLGQPVRFPDRMSPVFGGRWDRPA